MIELFKNLGLNLWWNLLVLVGIGLVVLTLTYESIEIVNRKHLFGLGIGFFLTGFSHIVAFKNITIPGNGGYWTTKEIVHTSITKILFGIGILISTIFLGMILRQLV